MTTTTATKADEIRIVYRATISGRELAAASAAAGYTLRFPAVAESAATTR